MLATSPVTVENHAPRPDIRATRSLILGFPDTLLTRDRGGFGPRPRGHVDPAQDRIDHGEAEALSPGGARASHRSGSPPRRVPLLLLPALLLVLLLGPAASRSAQARTLTFEERVAAQRA